MKNRMKLVVAVLLIILIVLVGWKLSKTEESGVETVTAPVDDPIDVTLDFYNPWLDSMLSTTTDVLTSELLNSPLISESLRTRLNQELSSEEQTYDPVLCQVETPKRIGAKIIYSDTFESQVMVIPRASEAPESAIVTLSAVDGKWMITDITCSRGEIAPDREFDFDREGYLLKQSVKPPLDPNNWHLVFTQNGQPGHTVPVFFTESSLCVSVDGAESACTSDDITEPTKARIKGDMTEAGVMLKRLELQ